MTSIAPIFVLIKFPVVFLASVSAVMGFVLAEGEATLRSIPFFCAVFILASGTAIINQYQERTVDALMERTKLRPLPVGTIVPATALGLGIAAIVAGLGSVLLLHGTVPFWLGVCSVTIYNGLYTFLKKRTAFASIPGAVAGALPPLMGFAAGGGDLASPMAVWLAMFFYIWQIPHFLLLMGIHGDDYRRANFPSLQEKIDSQSLGRIVFHWIMATACSALMFPLFEGLRHPAIATVILGLSVWTGWRTLPLVRGNDKRVAVFRRAFIHVNQYVLLMMILFIVDRGVP